MRDFESHRTSMNLKVWYDEGREHYEVQLVSGPALEEGQGVDGAGDGDDREAGGHARRQVAGREAAPHGEHGDDRRQPQRRVGPGAQAQGGTRRGGEEPEQQQGADRRRGFGGTDTDE